MPRGRPKKKPTVEEVAENAVETVKAETKPTEEKKAEGYLDLFKKALAEDPKAVVAMLEAVEMVGQGSRRTLESPEGRRTVPVKAEELEPPTPPTPAEPEPAVVFQSPHGNFKQVLRKGKKVHYGDDYEIVPPVLAEADNGLIRLTDPEQIELMRSKIRRRKQQGIAPIVVEIRDEIAEQIGGGVVKSIKNQSGVTADTPIEEVLVEAEAS